MDSEAYCDEVDLAAEAWPMELQGYDVLGGGECTELPEEYPCLNDRQAFYRPHARYVEGPGFQNWTQAASSLEAATVNDNTAYSGGARSDYEVGAVGARQDMGPSVGGAR